MIVSSSDGVPFGMGELTLNHVGTKTILVENRTGGAPKTMAGGAGMTGAQIVVTLSS